MKGVVGFLHNLNSDPREGIFYHHFLNLNRKQTLQKKNVKHAYQMNVDVEDKQYYGKFFCIIENLAHIHLLKISIT